MINDKKAQMDFEDISIAGIVFALVGAGVGIIVAKQTGSPVIFRILSGIVCGIVCYVLGSKILDG